MTHWTEFEGSESEQLIRWIDWLRTFEVASFIELAVREPAAWAKLREAPQLRRRIASILGWPTMFEGALINEQRLFDVAAVLLNRGCASTIEFLLDYPDVCYRLLVAGDLERVMALAGFDATLLDPPTNLTTFVDYVRHYRTLDAWLQLDPAGVQQACESGWQSEIATLLPTLPLQGWPTQGGPVFDVASLVVARYLETHGLRFCAPASRATGQVPAISMFKLLDHNVVLLVRSGSLGDGNASSPVDAREEREFVIYSGLLQSSLHAVAVVLQLQLALKAARIETKPRALIVSDLLRSRPAQGEGSSPRG
ncbi:hypothetical protein LLG90_24670 [Aromatoleum toluclasticum]|uniref:hypothetical protein n=1 Tax=Aromatoleum toluclasticum TaxID=92003 RepID=UPI001D189B89|nr:hypothetical protein [Aromatoleum toluclasticum]MCC4118556.1 hypothetical protein [Aromatoleum toluclasticum]